MNPYFTPYSRDDWSAEQWQARWEEMERQEMRRMVTADGIEINYSGLPREHQVTARLYMERGCEPGSGWSAILENNLRAVVMVDDQTFAQIREIWRWLYNYAPPQSWGSTERVREWMKARRAERSAA